MNQEEEEDQNWLDGIFVKLALEQFSEALQTKQRQFYGFYSFYKTSFGQKKVVKCEIM